MAKEYFMDEVAVLKKIVQEAGRMREYSENEMSDLIDHKIQERIEWARQNDEGLYWYYQNLSFKDKKTLKYTVTESVEGLGILGKIIMDPDITEVMINGYDTIFVEKSGKLMQLEEHFESSEDLERIVKRFVSSMDRTVDASNPIVDARLDDGSRVHVVLPPVALNGATVTIRRFSKNPMTIEKLLSYGSITQEAADFLEKVVATRHNVFVCGGTGSGKTTFLNALSNYIQPWERVITIEDSAELQIKNIPNLVRMETKKANSKDSNEITIRDLEELTSSQTTNQIFVMLEAIARKQREKVLTLYYDLIELKESPFGILALLVRQCNQLLQVKDLDCLGKSNGMIAKQMKVPAFVVGKLKDQAKMFSMDTLRDMIEACAKTDESIKTGKISDRVGVELLLIQFSQK